MTPVQRVLIVSLLCAFVVSRWVCYISEQLFSPITVILLSVGFVALGAAASGVPVVLLRRWLRPPFVLRPAVVAGALTIPAALLLYSHSRWALFPAVVGAFIVGTTIRSHVLVPAVTFMPAPGVLSPPMDGMWSARLRAALLSGMLLQAGLCFETVHKIPLAVFASSLGITVLISAPEDFRRPARMTAMACILLLALACFMTLVALFPHIWFERVPEDWNFVNLKPQANASDDVKAGVTPPEEHVYQGIIIYPEEVKHTILVPPLPALTMNRPGKPAAPLSIPFFGVYWLYRPPNHRPPPKSLVIHANPEERNLTSTDFVRLNMEARQNLGTYIDIACCRAIQVVAKSAEPVPESVWLELTIRDSANETAPAQSLGRVPVPPSQGPASVTMSFKLPDDLPLRRFDELVVVFHMARYRAWKAAKVGIERFVLQPR